jgi:hypothetical protein
MTEFSRLCEIRKRYKQASCAFQRSLDIESSEERDF